MYCGYANGFINYAKEVIGQTEKYWCGIQHQSTPEFIVPEHHKTMSFSEYGNEEDFKKKYPKKKKIIPHLIGDYFFCFTGSDNA